MNTAGDRLLGQRLQMLRTEGRGYTGELVCMLRNKQPWSGISDKNANNSSQNLPLRTKIRMFCTHTEKTFSSVRLELIKLTAESRQPVRAHLQGPS